MDIFALMRHVVCMHVLGRFGWLETRVYRCKYEFERGCKKDINCIIGSGSMQREGLYMSFLAGFITKRRVWIAFKGLQWE